MEPEWEAWALAIHGLIAAHSAVLRDVMRHLVEEGMMPPNKAGRILRAAADHDLPAAGSSGPTWDAARDELLAVAHALEGWPGTPRGRLSRGPRPDLG